jgi:hypothetical protein
MRCTFRAIPQLVNSFARTMTGLLSQVRYLTAAACVGKSKADGDEDEQDKRNDREDGAALQPRLHCRVERSSLLCHPQPRAAHSCLHARGNSVRRLRERHLRCAEPYSSQPPKKAGGGQVEPPGGEDQSARSTSVPWPTQRRLLERERGLCVACVARTATSSAYVFSWMKSLRQ